MDLADDIAYSLHDVEDFHRSGVLQFSPVSGEFRSWVDDRAALAAMDVRTLAAAGRQPGAGLERLRRRLRTREAWVFDEQTFADAITTVGEEFVDGVLATPYDGSMAGDRAISGFVSRWIDHLIGSVAVDPDPPVRSGYVSMSAPGLARGVGAQVRQQLLHPRPARPRHVPARPGADDRPTSSRGSTTGSPTAATPPGRRAG